MLARPSTARRGSRSWSSPLALTVLAVVVFLMAAACRFAYFAQVEHGRLGTPDTPAYEQLGARLNAGEPYYSKDYSGFGGFPAAMTRPPGYPAFLALLSAHPSAHQQRTAIIQILLSSLLAVALALAGARLAGPIAGGAAGIVYALDWTTVVNTPLSIADALLPIPIAIGFIFIVMAVAGERRRVLWLGLGGLSLAIACLVKPAAEVLIVVVFVALLMILRPRRLAIVFVAAAVLPVVPWAVRNDVKYGVLTVSPISTANLYFETALGTRYYETPISTNLNGLSSYQDRVDSQWTARRLSEAVRARALRNQALSIITRKVPIVLDQALMGFIRTSLGTDAATVHEDWSASPAPSRLITTFLPLAVLLVVWVLVVAGLIGAWRNDLVTRRVAALLAVGVLFALLPAAEPGGYARFRTAAAPMMALLAGFGVDTLVRWRRGRREVSLAPVGPSVKPGELR